MVYITFSLLANGTKQSRHHRILQLTRPLSTFVHNMSLCMLLWDLSLIMAIYKAMFSNGQQI